MYVCLCSGATCQTVTDAVARGALTARQVAAACGAGVDCRRCHRSLRAIIDATRKDSGQVRAVSQISRA